MSTQAHQVAQLLGQAMTIMSDREGLLVYELLDGSCVLIDGCGCQSYASLADAERVLTQVSTS